MVLIMQDPDQFQSSVRWWESKRCGCVVEWDGDDPEPLFVELINDYASRANRILQVSCCSGNLLDDFAVCDTAQSLLNAHGEYDLICACTGPLAFADYAGKLSDSGVLIGMICAETHYIETQEIFGRGFGWPPARPLRFAIPEAVTVSGLQLILFAEYFGTSFCPDTLALSNYLEASSIIPNFDAAKDAALIREVQRKLTSDRGIRNTEHLAIYAASGRI